MQETVGMRVTKTRFSMDMVAKMAAPNVDETGVQRFGDIEPFVDADTVAEFLSDSRAEVLKLTRAGRIRGYPYKGRQRHFYRYLLSEVAEDIKAMRKPAQRTISPAAPVSRRTKSNG